MKKFNYTVDLAKLKLNQAEVDFANKDNQKSMFENMLNAGLSSKYPSGLIGSVGRILARIYNKLDESSNGLLLLEESEFDLIKSTFCDDNVRFDPAQFRIICLYQFNIDKVEKVDEQTISKG